MALFSNSRYVHVYTFFIALLFLSPNTHAQNNPLHNEKWVYTSTYNKPNLNFDGYYQNADGERLDNKNRTASLNVLTYTLPMGQVMRNRLFYPNFSKLGEPQLRAKLTALGWTVDNSTFQIWKNESGKQYRCDDNDWKNTVEAAAKCYVELRSSDDPTWTYVRSETLYNSSDPTSIDEIRVYFTRSYVGSVEFNRIGWRDNPTPQRKIMDDTQLGRFMYDENVSLAEAYNWENKYDYDHSHLVPVVIKLLKYEDSSVKTEIEPTKNEQGETTGGFNLPSFCNWATPVCDLFDWLKDVSGLGSEDGAAPEKTTSLGDGESFDPNANNTWDLTGYGCPAPVGFTLTFSGVTQEIPISFDLACEAAEKAKIWFIFAAYMSGGLIIAGVRNA